MSSTAKALRQAALYAGFQGAGMLVSFVSFPILTRWLTVSEYGSLAIVNATVMMLVAVAKSGLGTAMLRQYAAVQADVAGQRRLVSSAFWTAVCMWLVVTAAYLLVGRVYLQQTMQLQMGLTLIAILMVATGATRDLYQAFLRARDQVLQSNVFQLTLRIAVVAGGVTAVLLNDNRVLAFFIGSAALELCCVVYVWGRVAASGGLKWSDAGWTQSRALLAFGVPLLTYEFASLLNDYVDRFLIAKFIGLEAVGQYSVGYNIASYAQAMTTAPMWMSVFPIYTRMWESQGREATERFLSTVLASYTAVACGVVMIACVASNELIHVLAGAKFAAAAIILPMVCAGMMVYGTTHIVGAGFYLQRRTALLAGMTAGAAAFKVALNFVLIPRYGIEGAAWATVASYASLTIAITILGSRLIRVRFSFFRTALHLLAAAATGILVSRISLEATALTLITKVCCGLLMYAALLLAFDRALRGSVLAALRRLPLRSSNAGA